MKHIPPSPPTRAGKSAIRKANKALRELIRKDITFREWLKGKMVVHDYLEKREKEFKKRRSRISLRDQLHSKRMGFHRFLLLAETFSYSGRLLVVICNKDRLVWTPELISLEVVEEVIVGHLVPVQKASVTINEWIGEQFLKGDLKIQTALVGIFGL